MIQKVRQIVASLVRKRAELLTNSRKPSRYLLVMERIPPPHGALPPLRTWFSALNRFSLNHPP